MSRQACLGIFWAFSPIHPIIANALVHQWFLLSFLPPSVVLVVNTSILILFTRLQVKQVQDWLLQWEKHHGNSVNGKKGNSSSTQKKAVLLSGNPGMGKTTTARLVCQLLGYEALEVLKFLFHILLRKNVYVAVKSLVKCSLRALHEVTLITAIWSALISCI